ncbi:MAG TPA: ABC transporter substrate-binding protein [Stellaceae bacterium]|nr:ABC transporter substrate-binding protein [Stellaceae bacterium]
MTYLGRTALPIALALAFGSPGAASAADSFDINVILPLTGGGAFVGNGHKESLSTLAEVVNKEGGIGGKPVRFVFHDDQTNPQVAVQLATDILAEKPAVILGSGLVAMCRAIGPLMKAGPVEYCLSPAVNPEPGSFIFSSSSSADDQSTAVLNYFRMNGWTKIAEINNTDATGQANEKSNTALIEASKDLKLVDVEHFNPTDISVTAQMTHIQASGAQAILGGVTGTPAANVFKAMIQLGMTTPIEVSSGNQSFAQLEQWSSFLPKGLVLSSALFPEHDGLLKLDPRVEKAQHDMYAALAAHGLKADNMEATSWDAGLIVVSALKALGPNATAVQVRDYILNLTDFPGIDGLYDFKKYPARGLGPDSGTVVRFDGATKSWVWLTLPGGAPLKTR